VHALGGSAENAGVENGGADSRGGKGGSEPYGTPNRDLMLLVVILLTESTLLAFVLSYCWIVSYDIRVCEHKKTK